MSGRLKTTECLTRQSLLKEYCMARKEEGKITEVFTVLKI